MTTDITPTPAPAPNTPGRKRKLDDTKRREVCALISAGCSLADAALYVRCDVATIYREAQRNAEFHDQLRDAEMCAQLNPLQAMQKAIGTHWRAAAWFLERAYPERFARRDPYALSPRQARKLMKDVLEVIAEETGHSKLGELLDQRIRPVFENAILTARDSRRTGRGLREAIRYFSQKE